MIVTTGNEVTGASITKYLGVVRGIVVRSPSIAQGFLGGLKQIVGGNIEAYAEVCEAARDEAFKRMVQHALERDADAIVVTEIKAAAMYRATSQAFAVLLPVQSMGVMGDDRTYEDVIAVRAVHTEDFMTADWSRLPYDLLARISTRIINEVKGVNRVVYDISSKPPATIEWE